MGVFIVSSDPSRWEFSEAGSGTHLLAIPTRADIRKCGICRKSLRRGLTVGCERCGVSMHGLCWERHVLSYVERVTLVTTDTDMAIVCRWCRS